jgi:hypothetical protein
MSRPYPDRRRKRPRRRLPDRYRHDRPVTRPGSFLDFGLRHIYDWVMPEVRGRARRELFNRIAGRGVIVLGAMMAVMGLGMGGPLGAIFGFVAGTALGDHFVRRYRLYRP